MATGTQWLVRCRSGHIRAHITNNTVFNGDFPIRHNIIANIVSDLCRVPPAHEAAEVAAAEAAAAEAAPRKLPPPWKLSQPWKLPPPRGAPRKPSSMRLARERLWRPSCRKSLAAARKAWPRTPRRFPGGPCLVWGGGGERN
jgi:hypothetical protein